jgi:hypothetical protein
VSTTTIDTNEIIRYLLGQLPEAESDRIDELCFVDDEFSARLLVVEDDLIDAYVRGQLSVDAHKHFEKKYLAAPHLRERVGFAEALKESSAVAQSSERTSIESSSWFRRMRNALSWEAIAARPMPAFVILAVVLGVAGFFLFKAYQNRDTPRIAGPATPPTPISGDSPSPTPPPAITPSLPIIDSKPAVFILTTGMRGESAGARALSVSLAAEKLTLQLRLDQALFSRYRAVLDIARGEKTVWTSGKVSPRAGDEKMVVINVPASRLEPGTYILKLIGIDDNQQEHEAETYTFRIRRE